MEHDITESINSTSASKVSGNVKRRTVRTYEAHARAKRTRLEAGSRKELSVFSDEKEDPMQEPKNPTRLEKVSSWRRGYRNRLFTDESVFSNDDEEDLKQSSKKVTTGTHMRADPISKIIAHETDIQRNHSNEVILNFKQSNKVDVGSSLNLKQSSIKVPNTLAINAESKIKNSFEPAVKLFTSKEDISKSSQEFLRLLLMDVEEQGNNSYKTTEFLPFTTQHKTPQKTDRQVVNNESVRTQGNLISSLAICAPKKEPNVFNINRNASLSSGQSRRNKLESNNNAVASIWIDRRTIKTSKVATDIPINSLKKTESSKRKLNFQDLCLNVLDKKNLKCLPDESCNKEENSSDDSDATICDVNVNDVHEPQVVGESLKSKCSLHLQENQDKKNESIFEGSDNKEDCNDSSIGGKSIKPNKPFPFIFSQQQYKAGHLNETSSEQKSKLNIEGRKANFIEGESQEKSKIISELIVKTTNNVIAAESSKLIFQNLCISDSNLEKSRNLSGTKKVGCSNSPIESNNEETNDSDDSDVTLFDLKNRLRENLKSKDFIYLEENQVEKNEGKFEYNTSSDHNKQINGEGSVAVKAKKSFSFFSQPQCKADQLRKGTIYQEQKLKPNNESKSLELKDLFYFENNSEKDKEHRQLKDFIFLEDNTNKDEESNTNTNSEDKKLELKDLLYLKNNSENNKSHSQSKDSIFLGNNPNKKSIFENANSTKTNDCVNAVRCIKSDDLYPFFFSQPQCKADESKLNKKGNQVRDRLWKSNNKNPPLNWIEQKSQELLLNSFSQPSPINENCKATKGASDFKSYRNIFQERKKSTFYTSKLEGKLKTCDEQEDLKLTGKKDVVILENICEQSQEDEEKGAETVFDCSDFLTPLEIKEENDSDDESFKSDCRFCESRQENEFRCKTANTEEICVKNNEAFLRLFSQPQRNVDHFEIEKKNVQVNCGVQKLNCPPNFLEFPKKYSSKPLPKATETKRGEHVSERTGTNCKDKNFKSLSCENKIINKEMSPENFKGFAKQTSTLVNGEQALETCLIDDDSSQKASTLEKENNQNQEEFFVVTAPKNTASQVNDFNHEDARDVHHEVKKKSNKQNLQQNKSCEDIQKQQDAFNLDDRSNTETEYFMLNEDSGSSGENFEKMLKEIDNALAKIKTKLTTEYVEQENSKTHLLSEINEDQEDGFAPVSSNSQNSEAIHLKEDTNQITFQDFCVRKMKDSEHYSTLQNKDSLFVNANEFEDFTKRHLEILSNQILAHVEQNNLSQQSNVSISVQRSSNFVDANRDEVSLSLHEGNEINQENEMEDEGTSFTRTFINRTRSNGTLSTGSKENFTLPEKRLRQGLNHVIRDKSLLCREKDNSSSNLSQTPRLRIIEKLSQIFMRLRDDVTQKKSPILEIRKQRDWSNCLFINNRIIMKPLGEAKTTIINFHRNNSKLNFNLIIFLLGKVINMLSEDSSCTKRELYYQLIKFVKSESQITNAVDQISCLLDEPPWQLGITAMSKGLIYGDLKIVASDQMINCNVPGGSLVPRDVQKITQLISDAYFILIVEKDAIFQKLLKEDLPNKLTRPFIMITGKGYPDVNLRFFIKKLMMVMSVPVFILVDADPYGIDIMLTYRFGSLSMSHLNEYLAVPNMKWIGVYPSEIIDLNVSHQPLTKKDETKIKNILKRPYCASFSKLKDEMEILLKNNFKAEIEGLLKSDTFLRDFYLPNKFLTQDYI